MAKSMQRLLRRISCTRVSIYLKLVYCNKKNVNAMHLLQGRFPPRSVISQVAGLNPPPPPPSRGFRVFCHACSSPSFRQHKRCIPASLEAYYAAQDANSRGRFYTVISHYSMAKQTTSHSVSPWLPGGAAGQQHNAKPPSGESH